MIIGYFVRTQMAVFDMKEKYPNRMLAWPRFTLLFFLLAWLFTSCIVEKLSLENRPCGPANTCLEGWSCVRGICVKDGTKPPNEPTNGDGGNSDKKVEPIQDKKPNQETTQPDKDEATPEPSIEQKPDTPPVGPNCKNYRLEAAQDECTKNTGLACYKMDKLFQPSTKKLVKPLAGAAAATNNGSWKTINNDSTKVYIYLAGGGANGTAGTSVSYTEVDRNGLLLGWKSTEALTTARTGAKAYVIRNYLYVMGGYASGDVPVDVVERAKINLSDGSLGKFTKVGTLSGLSKGMDVEYRHGYIYLAGGTSTTVQRALLLPDGTLGTQKALPGHQGLPTAQAGQIVSNHFFLYFLTPGNSKKIYFSRVTRNGELSGWCENTPLPQKTKSSSAYLDGRIMLLYNIEKADGTLDNRIYLSSLRDGTGEPRGGGLQKWICSDAKKAAVLKRPRKQATAIVTRGYLYVLGGIDSGSTTLDSVEKILLEYNDPTCNLDSDDKTNFLDNCAKIYNPNQSNLCSPQMSLVPAGSFQRGDGKSANTPKKTITLDGFFIDTAEVTNAQYKECVADSGACTAPQDVASGGIADYYTNTKYAKHPVVHITWKQALTYCQWKGKRLPTEAEWEKASRALTNYLYPWGNDSPVCSKAHINSCTEKAPKEVGIHPSGSSPYGVQNLAGNVREWTQDYYDRKYYIDGKETSNPKGPSKGQTRVIKGSSFKTSGAGAYTISKRENSPEGASADDLGFRCALSVYPTAP